MSGFYDNGRRLIAEGQIATLTDVLKAALVSVGYVPNIATHQFVSQLGGFRVATDQTLVGKTTTVPVGGVVDASNVYYQDVPVGYVVPYIVVYKSTGVDATSPLVALFDSGTDLPFTTNGDDVLITWNEGSARIWRV